MSSADESILEEFVLENRQAMLEMEQDLLSMEDQGSDTETINRMFRAIHSMKGSSGYLELENIQSLSHLGETLMDQLRKQEREVTADVVDALLATVDTLRAMIDSEDLGASHPIGDTKTQLTDVIDGASAGKKEPVVEFAVDSIDTATLPGQFDLDAYAIAGLSQKKSGGRALYYINAGKDRQQALLSSLNEVGVVVAHAAAGAILLQSVLDPEMLCGSFELKENEVSLVDLEGFQESLGSPDSVNGESPAVEQAVMQPETLSSLPSVAPDVRGKAGKEAPTGRRSGDKKAGNGAGKNGEGHMIKINARLLDELLRFTGNMVMSRNQLLTRYDFSDDPAFATLSQAITEVHRNVVQTRMLSVGTLFDRFKRVIRDLAKKLGKQVQLKTVGAELELDRTILEAFVDPLTHMVRNSLDHGIESEDERKGTQKNPIATITLSAYQESGEIIISVADDGRGVDVKRVKEKALERKLMSREKLDAMPEGEAVKLIFAPGFSTAETLSEVSGRGVGMDVVRTNIENLGGVIDCQSQLGAGTTIQARLPLTKAMVTSSLISALVVRVGGQRFCIPQSAVNELINVSLQDRKDKIKSLQGQEVFQHRELVLPIVHLQEVLGLEPEEGHEEPADDANSLQAVLRSAQTLIVLQHRQHLFGVIVEEIIGIEEAVVRDMPKFVEGASVFAGHTVLGDGRVVMLIDINGIVERRGMAFSHQSAAGPSDVPALSVGKRADRQTMIVFNYAESEYFAIPLELVSLVEKIRNVDIRTVGDRHYYPFKGSTIPLLYLDKHLPVTPISRNQENYNLILPARVRFPIGVITNADMTVCEVSGHFDAKITHEQGVLGTFMHDDRLVMLLDLYALFEHDDPDHFDTSGSDSQEPARILIVEDSMFYRRLNSTYLSGAGRQLTLVNDGEEALAALRDPSTVFDLVVSDIEMPNMDGFELIKAIRSDPSLRNLPVIALTALQDDASRDRGLRLGFDEYVVKVDKDGLNECVNRHARKVRESCDSDAKPLAALPAASSR